MPEIEISWELARMQIDLYQLLLVPRTLVDIHSAWWHTSWLHKGEQPDQAHQNSSQWWDQQTCGSWQWVEVRRILLHDAVKPTLYVTLTPHCWRQWLGCWMLLQVTGQVKQRRNDAWQSLGITMQNVGLCSERLQEWCQLFEACCLFVVTTLLEILWRHVAVNFGIYIYFFWTDKDTCF